MKLRNFWKAVALIFLVVGVAIAIDSYWPHSMAGMKLSSTSRLLVYNITSRGHAEELKGDSVHQAVDKFNSWILENPSGWKPSFVDTVPQVHFIDGDTTIDIWGNRVVVNSPRGSFEKTINASQTNKVSELLKDLKQE